MKHSKATAVLWGTTGEPFSVGWCQPQWPGDSGLTILLTDAPDPAEVEPGDPRVGVVCLDCMLDDFPGIAVALELARAYGVADLDDGDEWVVGYLSRLDSDASRNRG